MSNDENANPLPLDGDDVERENDLERCVRLENQVSALKEVSNLRKNLLELREKEAKDLIAKLRYFEDSVEREKNLRKDMMRRLELAEKQCSELTEKLQTNTQSLGDMKSSYEDRISGLIADLQKSQKEFQERTEELNGSELRNINLNTRVEDLDKLLSESKKKVKKLETHINSVAERNKVFSFQINLLRNLFHETDEVEIDFDRIKAIGDIVRETQNLPATELENDELILTGDASERRPSLDLQNIIENIDADRNSAEIPGEESCYKSIDTNGGPQLVLSVSRTFIKLKDLILEKKSLQREIDTLKTLNSKLESKVDKQERRLYCVSVELNKTWSLVSKLKMQHDKLHTNEAVLKYELQEKRKQLEKLKTDLSQSRDKWLKARQKNSQTQIEWQNLRDEFSRRKQESSQESAFSENMSSSSAAEDEVEQEHGDGVSTSPIDNEEEDDEEELEGACGITIIDEDASFVDPLEELVSELVEEIEATAAEGDAEDEGVDDTSTSGAAIVDRVLMRANRLRVLEEQCHLLHTKLMASTARSATLANKLAALHSHYGTRDTQDQEDSENYELETGTTETSTPTTETSSDTAYASATEQRGDTDDTEMPSENDSQDEEMPVIINHTTENNNEDDDEIIVNDAETGLLHNAEVVVDLVAVPPVNFVEPMPNLEILQPFVRQTDILATPTTTTTTATTTDYLLFQDSDLIPALMVATHNPVMLELELEDQEPDTLELLTELEISHSRAQSQSPLPSSLLLMERERYDNTDGTESEDHDLTGASSNSGSPDPNLLGRLIIKQLPKRLDILRRENQGLMKEITDTQIQMKETKKKLKREVEKQKRLSHALEIQIEEKSLIEFELREELEKKQKAIEDLQKEIDDGSTSIDCLQREKESIAAFFKIFLEEKTDMENPKVPSQTIKSCHKCEKSFSILKRRKHHCKICGQVFCKECATERDSNPHIRSPRKPRICTTCFERREHLHTLARAHGQISL